MSLLNFDATRIQPATGELEPIPAAWYDVVMDQSEMKPTKDSATTGNAFLECRFNVASGQFAGRKLFSRLNLRNNNPVAAEIAQKELSAICHAVGILQVQDSQQLHGIPLKVKVKVRAGDAQYGASNEISTFKPANFVPDTPVAGGAMAPGAMAPGAFPPPAAAPAQQQPWAAPGQGAAPAGWAPQQPQQPQQPAAAPQQPWQQAPQQPAQAPQQPAPQQPWQQPAAAAPAQAPAWGAPPAAAPAGFPPAAYPPAAAPAQPPAAAPWAGTPQDPQQQVPPWQRAPGT